MTGARIMIMTRFAAQPVRTFDPATHITAGQLRRLRFYIPEFIPDRAYVRRTSVGLAGRELLDDDSPTAQPVFLEPFCPPV